MKHDAESTIQLHAEGFGEAADKVEKHFKQNNQPRAVFVKDRLVYIVSEKDCACSQCKKEQK